MKFKDDVKVVTFETLEDGTSVVTDQYTEPLNDSSESDFQSWLFDFKFPFLFQLRKKY